jgi:hypothetical protein
MIFDALLVQSAIPVVCVFDIRVNDAIVPGFPGVHADLRLAKPLIS